MPKKKKTDKFQGFWPLGGEDDEIFKWDCSVSHSDKWTKSGKMLTSERWMLVVLQCKTLWLWMTQMRIFFIKLGCLQVHIHTSYLGERVSWKRTFLDCGDGHRRWTWTSFKNYGKHSGSVLSLAASVKDFSFLSYYKEYQENKGSCLMALHN